MKFNRSKNASRNVITGILERLYHTLVPFAMRTAMIHFLGVEYLGLDGLFTSILSVLNLAELGVGGAMIFSMYRPIAEDDDTRIKALMLLYKKYYRVIGLIVLAGGLVICPIIPSLIKSDVPSDINVYILFLLNLGATVLSYWLFAYKNSLLQAYQRRDILSKVSIVVSTARYILQFYVLFRLHNYYIYLLVALASQAASNIVTSIIANKMFPHLQAEGNLPAEERKKINHRIRDLFTAKIGGVVVYSMDTIVVSSFLGLSVLAIYQNYYFIVSAVLSITSILINSSTAGIGNSLVVETKEKNFGDLKTLTFLMCTVSAFCSSCIISVIQPFMHLWAGPQLMFDFHMAALFGIYYYIVQINALLNCYKDAAGIWHEDRFRPLVTAFVNLALNITLVQIMGIYGILLSTLISMLGVGMPWLMHNLFSTIFDKAEKNGFLLFLIKQVIIDGLVCLFSVCIGSLVPGDGIPIMAFRIFVCLSVSIIFVLVFFNKTEEYARAIGILRRLLMHRSLG